MVPGRQLGTMGTQCGAKRGHPEWCQEGSLEPRVRSVVLKEVILSGARKAAWNHGYAVWC